MLRCSRSADFLSASFTIGSIRIVSLSVFGTNQPPYGCALIVRSTGFMMQGKFADNYSGKKRYGGPGKDPPTDGSVSHDVFDTNSKGQSAF